VGPHGGRRTTATTIINRCANVRVVGIITSCSSFSHFVAAAPTNHSSKMSLSGRHGTTTDSAWRLPSRRPPMPMGTLFLTLPGRHCQISIILPYVFLHRTQPTTTPLHPSMLPHSALRSAVAPNSHPACCWKDVCGGAGSEAPWRPWENGGCHGPWVQRFS